MNSERHAGSRRVVARVGDDDRSFLEESDIAPREAVFQATPGMRTSILWASDGSDVIPAAGTEDPAITLTSLHPDPGHTVFMTLTLPPMSVFASSDFDPSAAAAEQLLLSPGIAERMEPLDPGFHTTETFDYVAVMTGEIWLVVDSGETRLLPGDVVIQLGSRHAWQNRSEEPAALFVVLNGANRAPSAEVACDARG